METRSNHVLVGAVALALLALLAASIIWIARLNAGDQNAYDIFFKQSVDGLATGSEVTFSGVPSGQVSEIVLWDKDPEFVRVRVMIDRKIEILQGTTATVQGSFTGVSKIQLDGALRGAPPIVELGPEGKPVIPATTSGLGQIMSNAPLLLERLATLAERLNVLLSDENQSSINGILSNTDRLTDNMADASPQIERTLAELQGTLRQANLSLAAFEKTMGSTDRLLNQDGESLAKQLRETLKSAQLAANSLNNTLADARPAMRQLADSTMPTAESALRELRETSESLRKVTEKLDDQGAGALLGGDKLPEYKP